MAKKELGAAAVILDGRGYVLLVKHSYGDLNWEIPGGGAEPDESVADTAVRETREETGLRTEVRRFLARIAYHSLEAPTSTPLFHTFAFLLDEISGTLGALDATEQIEDWREVAIADLPRVADYLDGLRTQGTQDIGGDWRAWGKFRAVVHRAVHQALASG